MSEPTQSDDRSDARRWGRVQPELKRHLEEFARAAAQHLQTVGRQKSIGWERWDRDSDGVFRLRARSRGWRWKMWTEFEEFPGYHQLCDALGADPCIGPQLNMMIGTLMGSSRVEPRNLIGGIVTESWSKTRTPVFDERRFDSAFNKWRDLFEATCFEARTVAVLPGVSIEGDTPLDIDGDHLMLDRLTDTEIAAALSTGLARVFPVDSTIFNGELVGVRRISWLDKTVSDPELDMASTGADGDGAFGRRPLDRLDLFGDDIATLLRLHGTGSVVISGVCLLRTERPGMAWHTRQGPSNARGNLCLATTDLSPLQALWGDLCRNASRNRPPSIALSRFTSAFDRSTLQDRLIDLMIAAEAIFLQEDGSPEDRGELSFRMALRAAHFIVDPTRDKVAIFDQMKKAYGLRSRLVHGGIHATTPADVDPVSDLVRLALVQALATFRARDAFGRPEFWKALQLG